MCGRSSRADEYVLKLRAAWPGLGRRVRAAGPPGKELWACRQEGPWWFRQRSAASADEFRGGRGQGSPQVSRRSWIALENEWEGFVAAREQHVSFFSPNTSLLTPRGASSPPPPAVRVHPCRWRVLPLRTPGWCPRALSPAAMGCSDGALSASQVHCRRRESAAGPPAA